MCMQRSCRGADKDYLHPVPREAPAESSSCTTSPMWVDRRSCSAGLVWTVRWQIDTTRGLDSALRFGLAGSARPGSSPCSAGQWLAQLWLDDRSDLNDGSKSMPRDSARMELQGTIDNESRPACAWMPVLGRFLTASRLQTGGHATQLRRGRLEHSPAALLQLPLSQAAMPGEMTSWRRSDENGRGYTLERTDADTAKLRTVEETSQRSRLLWPGQSCSDGDQESKAEFSASFARGQ